MRPGRYRERDTVSPRCKREGGGRLGDGCVDEGDARFGRLLTPHARPQAVVQGPPKCPRAPQCPPPYIRVGRGLLTQLLDLVLRQRPSVSSPVEQVAVSADLLIAERGKPVPGNGVDEIEAEVASQITFNLLFEG